MGRDEGRLPLPDVPRPAGRPEPTSGMTGDRTPGSDAYTLGDVVDRTSPCGRKQEHHADPVKLGIHPSQPVHSCRLPSCRLHLQRRYDG